MTNRTDPLAMSIHGTNPQYLIEKIVRGRIYSNNYWINQCSGLTAETLVDRAMELTEFGGCYGGNNKPTKFLCLILKMLQLQPEKEIIIEFILNQDHKYVRLLGAFYLRLVGKAVDIYQYLEPLLCDSRTIKKRTKTGTIITHVDEFIDELLTAEDSCDIHLPRLPKRWMLEAKGELTGPRKSELDEDEINEHQEKEKAENHNNNVQPSQEIKQPESQSQQVVRDKRDEDEDHNRRRERWKKDRKKDRRSSRSRSKERSSRRSRSISKERRSRRSRSRSPRRDHRSSRRSRSTSRDRRHTRRDRGDDDYNSRRGSRRSGETEDDSKERGRRNDKSSRDNNDENKKKGSSNPGEVALDIDETNKLREKLGLKPLRK